MHYLHDTSNLVASFIYLFFLSSQLLSCWQHTKNCSTHWSNIVNSLKFIICIVCMDRNERTLFCCHPRIVLLVHVAHDSLAFISLGLTASWHDVMNTLRGYILNQKNATRHKTRWNVAHLQVAQIIEGLYSQHDSENHHVLKGLCAESS